MIAIKNVKMPSSCYDCPFAKNERTNDYGSFCECGILEDYETINLLEHSKHPDCPLVDQEAAIDKIRAETEEYRDSMRWNSESLVKWEAINYVLEHIIDKYRAESEE